MAGKPKSSRGRMLVGVGRLAIVSGIVGLGSTYGALAHDATDADIAPMPTMARLTKSPRRWSRLQIAIAKDPSVF